MRHTATARMPLLAALAVAVTICAGILSVPGDRALATLERPLEGFGATTSGGSGGESYVVTSLADSGPGTLRDALGASDRSVSFAVGGTIELQSTIRVTGANITIDGSTAPPPGVTITAAHSGVSGALLEFRGAHDIIVRHLRITDAQDDNLRIYIDAYNIVVDHCSVRRAGDGNLDISDGAHDITVQWSILADNDRNSLIRTDLYNISLHHNLYANGYERNPQLDDSVFVDMVNNVVYGWGGNYGARIRNGSSANVVKNYFVPGPGSDPSDALVLEPDAGPVYLEGNVLPSSCGTSGTTGTLHEAPEVTELSADDALLAVLEEAGAFPRDADDQQYVEEVSASPVESTSWGQIKAWFR